MDNLNAPPISQYTQVQFQIQRSLSSLPDSYDGPWGPDCADAACCVGVLWDAGDSLAVPLLDERVVFGTELSPSVEDAPKPGEPATPWEAPSCLDVPVGLEPKLGAPAGLGGMGCMVPNGLRDDGEPPPPNNPPVVEENGGLAPNSPPAVEEDGASESKGLAVVCEDGVMKLKGSLVAEGEEELVPKNPLVVDVGGAFRLKKLPKISSLDGAGGAFELKSVSKGPPVAEVGALEPKSPPAVEAGA